MSTAWADLPVVITVAPTGAEVTRDHNPAVPYTPAEIAEAVIDAAGVGATVAHLHVREQDGTPSFSKDLFAEVVSLLRAEVPILTMVSTGGAVGMTIDERATGLLAKPDLSSIETGSINFGGELFSTLPSETVEIARRAHSAGIGLEVEIFELGHIDAAFRFRDAGQLPDPLRFNFVLGVPGAAAANPHNLTAMVSALPLGAIWGVTAIGRHQRRMLALGVLLGANCIRIGFEDAVYLRRGRLAESNAELVADIADLVRSLGREVATHEQARQLLQINQGV